jgi:low temperature requirement protein LtrA
MLERLRLFLLIALGETIVTPGAAVAAAPIRVTTLMSGTLALAVTLCLWWLYFRGEPIAKGMLRLPRIAFTRSGSARTGFC